MCNMEEQMKKYNYSDSYFGSEEFAISRDLNIYLSWQQSLSAISEIDL